MRANTDLEGAKGEAWAISQFLDSNLFKVASFPQTIYTGWDIVAQLLDCDTRKELHDIFFIQAKNYTMKISNGYAILDEAIKVWHLKRWEELLYPTLIIAYNKNPDSGYWIWHYEIINQIRAKNPNWRNGNNDSKITVRIPISNKLMPNEFIHIYQTVRNYHIQSKKLRETAPLEPAVQDFTSFETEAMERSGGKINSFIVDTLEQVLSEYRGHEIISNVCKEIKYQKSEHRDLEFLMFPQRLSIPYNDVLKNSSWSIHGFGSSIANGEANAVFDLISNSNLIEKKSDLDFSRETIISVFEGLIFNPTYVLISNDLFVEWMEIFYDRTFFTEKQIVFKFEDEDIPITFVTNELSFKKVLLIKRGSIESIVKCAEDTPPIINFKNDIPIGPRGSKLDMRIKSDSENIEFVFRTVRSLNLIDPMNILLLDFSKNE